MLQRSNTLRFPLMSRGPLSRRTMSGISLILFLILSLLAGAVSFLLTQHQTQQAHAATTHPMGLNLDFNEQSLVDMVQNEPRFQGIGSNAVTTDTNGWPTSDFAWVIDNRYVFGWVSGAVNIDPQKKSTNISGTYKLSFTGQATLADASDDPAHGGTTVTNQQYNSATNTTTADVNIPNPTGGVLMILQFTNTKRTATSASGTGLTNIKAIRPGYAANTTQVFTNEWLSSLTNHNWNAFRWMVALGTNDYADPATDQSTHNELYPIRVNWPNDRRLPNAGPLYNQVHPGVHGVPWEYVVLIAQITHKDQWINIPVNASDDYVTQVANLMKNGNSFTGNQGIPSDVNLYIEYSNEMWHYGFHQGNWNYQAGKDEVAAGGSNLNYDNVNNDDTWRFRRIAKRTVEIGNQFKTAFNDNGTRIRPVINNAFTDHDTDMLNYVKNNYGTVNTKLYAISQTGYYGSSDKSSVDAIIAGEKAASDTNKTGYQTSRNIANQFGIHSLVYEGGQDEEGNKQSISPVDTTLANQFAAARDPRMQDVEVYDANNWFGVGGELYMQFEQVGRYSTYGMWGLSDDITNQTSGKWKGVDQIMGAVANPTPTPTPTPTPGTTPTPTPTPNPGGGSGLKGDYYNTIDLSGSVTLSRTDATVNFDWGTGSPGTGVNADNFSVRWTGQVQATVSGSYTFTTLSDDGIRLWVNSTQIINNWTDHYNATNTSSGVMLTAGQKYDIKLEYYEHSNGAVAKLSWTPPAGSTVIIPQSQLYPAGSTTTTNLALNKSVTASGGSACASSEAASNAVDGNGSTKWCQNGNNNGPYTLQVDLGASHSITGFTLNHAGSGGEDTGYNTSDYQIAVSTDGSNWTTVVNVSNNTANVTNHTISATTARYVRFTISKAQTSTSWLAVRLYEFQVLGS